MLGPSKLCRIRFTLSAVDICPKGLGAEHIMLGPSQATLGSGQTSGVFGVRPKCRAGMVDGPSEGVILQDEICKLLDGREEGVVLLRSIDDIGALKPFLRQYPTQEVYCRLQPFGEIGFALVVHAMRPPEGPRID